MRTHILLIFKAIYIRCFYFKSQHLPRNTVVGAHSFENGLFDPQQVIFCLLVNNDFDSETIEQIDFLQVLHRSDKAKKKPKRHQVGIDR